MNSLFKALKFHKYLNKHKIYGKFFQLMPNYIIIMVKLKP